MNILHNESIFARTLYIISVCIALVPIILELINLSHIHKSKNNDTSKNDDKISSDISLTACLVALFLGFNFLLKLPYLWKKIYSRISMFIFTIGWFAVAGYKFKLRYD